MTRAERFQIETVAFLLNDLVGTPNTESISDYLLDLSHDLIQLVIADERARRVIVLLPNARGVAT